MCEHRETFKVYLVIFNIMHERVNQNFQFTQFNSCLLLEVIVNLLTC